jgi:hypothetical protein
METHSTGVLAVIFNTVNSQHITLAVETQDVRRWHRR